jgi:hypothetical protein
LAKDLNRIKGPQRRLDRTGKKSGRWTVLRAVGEIGNKGQRWLCRCECGTERVVDGDYLSGMSKSCGCLSRENSRVVSRMNFADRHARNRLGPGRSAATSVYRAYERGAVKRRLPFNLTFERFLQLTGAECHYCGSSPARNRTIKRGNGEYTYNGIDRVDNACGYVEGNVVTCCTRCNTWKLALTRDQFIEHATRISDRVAGAAKRVDKAS